MFQTKKLFVCLLVVALAVPMISNATITRLRGLGGEHLNSVTKDQANYTIWPQLVKNYGKMANAEFGGAGTEGWDLKSVSANYDWGAEKGVVNFALNKMQNTNYTQMIDPTGDGPGINNALTLRYGRKLGGENLGGVGLYYGYESYEHKETPKVEQSASVMGIQLGYTLTEQMIDLALGFETAGFTNKADGSTVSEPDGMSSLRFDGRWMWDYSETAMLVPNISFQSTSDNIKDGNEISTSHMKIGAGHNWWPTDNALVIFDFGLEMNSSKVTPPTGSEATNSDNYMPYWRIGAETKVFEWLDARAGAERFWESMVEAGDTPAEETWGRANTYTYLGASVHWNRLLFDLLVSPDFVQGGPYFVSGNGSNMFTQASMKINFNK